MVIIKILTNQHGLDGGHQWRFHSEEFPGSWTIGRLLLVPQHSINHIAQITGGLEGIVGVWIHGIQTKQEKRDGNSTVSTLKDWHIQRFSFLEGFKDTYTCLAPAFIFKSCLMSRMMHFRSLPVHLTRGVGGGRLLLGTAAIISTTILHYNALGMRKAFERNNNTRKKIDNNYWEITAIMSNSH